MKCRRAILGASVGAIGGVVAALLVAAVSLVTCSRCCRAAIDPMAATVAACDEVYAKWRASR